MVEQEFADDEREYLSLISPRYQRSSFFIDKPMPIEIEDIKLLQLNTKLKTKCNSCPGSSCVVYILMIGDFKVAKFCPKCAKRLRQCIIKTKV